MSSTILYDLPRRGRCASWSYNPWKTRLVLNFKDIPYTTEWVEYPDLETKFKAMGVPPHAAGTEPTNYTIPVVRLSNGSLVMDSKAIARRLEELHPAPPLHLDSPEVARVEALVMATLKPFAPMFHPAVARDVLNPASQGYFYATREKRYGMPLDEVEKKSGGEVAWAAAKQPIADLAAVVKKNGGPFVMGNTPSYADFLIVSIAQFFKCVKGQESLDRFLGHDPALVDLYKACEKWTVKDT